MASIKGYGTILWSAKSLGFLEAQSDQILIPIQ
jgi:hypothetical protein